MSKSTIPLEMIKIASPCTASWDAMAGDDTTRFCDQCEKHVYNLSSLSRDEAEALVMKHEGKMCVRFYQRPDGTMLTQDCPVGWRAIQRRFVFIGGAAAGVLFILFSFVFTTAAFAFSVRGNGQGGVRFVNPITQIRDMLFPPPPCVMGGIGPPPIAPPAPPVLPVPPPAPPQFNEEKAL